MTQQQDFQQLPRHIQAAIQAAADTASTSIYNVDWQQFLDMPPAPDETPDFFKQRKRYDAAVAERRLAEPIEIPEMPTETEMVRESRAFGLPLERIRRGHQMRIDAAKQAESERAAAHKAKQESEQAEHERAALKQLIAEGKTLELLSMANDKSKPEKLRIVAKAAVLERLPGWKFDD